MPKWLKRITDAIGFWQTWFSVLTVGIPTVWTLISTIAAGLPAYQIILYASAVFAIVSGGALFAVRLLDWAKEKTGNARTCKLLRAMQARNLKVIKINQLAQLWTEKNMPEKDQAGTTSNLFEWNTRLRDLKEAASQGLLEVSAGRRNGTIDQNTRVTIESAIRFIENAQQGVFRVLLS
jgi:hypothetical protein